ncbi:MAG: YidB family protein [Phreatobacter sp.]|nr:YidB family protein [Bradyrhizobium sp.]
MARGLPSMTALLGLLALAGYQNRDKIGEWINGATAGKGAPGGQSAGFDKLLAGLGNTSPGGLLNGGLGAILDSFRQSGQAETVDSWVGTGPNKPVAASQIRQALGPDVLADIMQRTGLSEEEILSRLSQTLPEAVDKYTPDGRLPQS